MKSITLVFLAIATICFTRVFGQQKLKGKTENLLGTELSYNVDDNGKKTGSFLITDIMSKNVLAKGSYYKGNRSGTWYFYVGNNKVQTCYNYDQHKLLLLDTADLKQTKIKILSQNQEIIEHATVPVLLFSKELFARNLINKFLAMHSSDSTNLHIEVVASLLKPNETNYAVHYFVNGKETVQSIDLNVEQVKIEWLPAMYNKEFIPSEVSLKFAFDGLQATAGNVRRFRWDN